jgi:hypothetical protein
MSGGMIGPEYDGQIRQTILAVRNLGRMSSEMDLSAQERAASRFSDHAVILDAALAAATHALTGATSALATVCRWSTTGSEYTETELQVTVWNHSESKSYSDNTFGIARFINGHWLFFGDCEGMLDRVVV